LSLAQGAKHHVVLLAHKAQLPACFNDVPACRVAVKKAGTTEWRVGLTVLMRETESARTRRIAAESEQHQGPSDAFGAEPREDGYSPTGSDALSSKPSMNSHFSSTDTVYLDCSEHTRVGRQYEAVRDKAYATIRHRLDDFMAIGDDHGAAPSNYNGRAAGSGGGEDAELQECGLPCVSSSDVAQLQLDTLVLMRAILDKAGVGTAAESKAAAYRSLRVSERFEEKVTRHAAATNLLAAVGFVLHEGDAGWVLSDDDEGDFRAERARTLAAIDKAIAERHAGK
jgi:hypothetical protein